ncbi:MAG: Rrf2 family transcriptional regulator [Candidatus Sericytochromatia bacterium]|nr:Rrf2 family transcriptional regulator [Candidatus Sericytochromatia bacterium]
MITRATEYACLAMLYLAKQPQGETVNTADVAREERIPPSFLAKVINQLSKAGLLTSRRGPSGGLELARDAQAITLKQVVEAIEGELAVNLCTGSQDYACFRLGCSLKSAFSAAQQVYLARLDAVTLADLVRDDRYTADQVPPPASDALSPAGPR